MHCSSRSGSDPLRLPLDPCLPLQVQGTGQIQAAAGEAGGVEGTTQQSHRPASKEDWGWLLRARGATCAAALAERSSQVAGRAPAATSLPSLSSGRPGATLSAPLTLALLGRGFLRAGSPGHGGHPPAGSAGAPSQVLPVAPAGELPTQGRGSGAEGKPSLAGERHWPGQAPGWRQRIRAHAMPQTGRGPIREAVSSPLWGASLPL